MPHANRAYFQISFFHLLKENKHFSKFWYLARFSKKKAKILDEREHPSYYHESYSYSRCSAPMERGQQNG